MKLIFATNNQNKVNEIRKILPQSIEVLSLMDIGCQEDIPEPFDTLEENAMGKARYVAKNYGYNCFADDTGLEVDALDGKPGVKSARYAGENRDFDANNTKLLGELGSEENRKARFRTVIALIINNKETLFDGIVEGEITHKRKGNKGFGYDPIFMPKGYPVTFAQINLKEKNEISHRGRAVKKLVDYLGEKYS